MRSKTIATFLSGIILLLATQVTNASDFPHYWDGRERVSKPDLTAVKRIRFVTTVDYPPFNFIDNAGRISGFNIDLARAICAELEATALCQIEARPWNELQSALESGEAEAILAGLRPTASLRGKYTFTAPYMRLAARFLIRNDQTLPSPSDKTLENKTVGVIADSVHQAIFADYFPKSHWVGYPTRELMLKDLKAKKIDAVFGDGSDLSFWIGSPDAANCCTFAGRPYTAPQFLGDGLMIATTIQNSDLAEGFNFALKSMEAKGTISELYLRYFPIDFY
ncbi:transporter substrate-binding domain-containing protein [Phyllobacterium sp. YR531]|uniref:transporter substrate-binding domain-containing protein n=1 Tax=Phyllobacterium sp. YR531 TaxID=1144343 RepID=UPI00026FA114|nr:transporter substrate-binding domain-containing protein [Phyllobacterium sp. YR531]EJN05367.1 periplasmic component of amino acid ABC-type transporter/signal transduction system [Phyllobacterium sp. YR531]